VKLLTRPLLLLVWAVTALSLAGCVQRSGSTDTLTYRLPTAFTIKMGESLPGTNIQYVSEDDTGVHLSIDGQDALKRKGDSLDWAGEPVAGVDAKLNLRIVWYTAEELYLAGTGKLVVSDVAPAVTEVNEDAELKYSGAMTFSVRQGDTIPGSLVVYEGQGDEGAQFSGAGDYSYRKAGDSVYWEGQLRDGVSIRLDLRLVQYSESRATLAGLVTLWVDS
jgi:hypothetical protein